MTVPGRAAEAAMDPEDRGPDCADLRDRVMAWNRTARPYPRDQTIAGIFAGQCAVRPEAIAVIDGEHSLSYRELDLRARRLAAVLGRLEPGAPVAFCLERGLDMIVVMLAILQAGGAYVPLDPGFPVARLALLVAECEPVAVIVSAALADRVPRTGRLLILEGTAEAALGTPVTEAALGTPVAEAALDPATVETAPESLAAAAARQFPAGAGPSATDIATILYTSGSTGVPKGVCVTQRGVLRLVLNPGYVRFDEHSVVAQVNKASFDASTFEIWGALLNGGRLVILPTSTLLSAKALEQALGRDGITTLVLPSALLQTLARERPALCRGLDTLLYGGEPCDPRSLRSLLEQGPPRHLINGYGPTETATFALTHEVSLEDACAGAIPIGRPIAQSQAYVLDDHVRLVEPGTVGELYLGGDGVARGYWRRPELTRQGFLDDPFSTEPGALLYRSGDRVRQRPDGIIEFLGRVDLQVKLRGHRVDLEEIEVVLRGQPDVLDCALVVRGLEAEHKYLEAFVVLADAEALEDAGLRFYLAERLPDFMVPAKFWALPELPLTLAGKLDRNGLKTARGRLLRSPGGGRDQAENPIEARVLLLCQGLLGDPGLGMADDFLEVGGNSLLAMRLVTEIERDLGVALTVSHVFLAETLRALAGFVAASGAALG